MKRFTDYQETVAATDNETGRFDGGITITKVVREFVGLKVRKGHGETIGSRVDEIIATSLANGDEIQSFEIAFEPEQWNRLRSGE